MVPGWLFWHAYRVLSAAAATAPSTAASADTAAAASLRQRAAMLKPWSTVHPLLLLLLLIGGSLAGLRAGCFRSCCRGVKECLKHLQPSGTYRQAAEQRVCALPRCAGPQQQQ